MACMTDDAFNGRASRGSVRLDVGGLDDRRPARNLPGHKSGKRLLSAPRLVWNFRAEVEQPLARVFVIVRLVESVGQSIEDRLRCSPGRKQSEPSRHVELRQPRFLCGRYVRETGTTRLRTDRKGLDRAADRKSVV